MSGTNYGRETDTSTATPGKERELAQANPYHSTFGAFWIPGYLLRIKDHDVLMSCQGIYLALTSGGRL